MNFPWHQYLFALLFIIAGFNHFRKPKIYERIMPIYLPVKSTLVFLTGILEMIFGFMLITDGVQSVAAWSIIILLMLFIPVHINMLINEKAAMKLPKWILILRIPLQFALMYWAYQYV